VSRGWVVYAGPNRTAIPDDKKNGGYLSLDPLPARIRLSDITPDSEVVDMVPCHISRTGAAIRSGSYGCSTCSVEGVTDDVMRLRMRGICRGRSVV
jgi:hypothetical protein